MKALQLVAVTRHHICLDVGCGDGFLLPSLRNRAHLVVGCDLSLRLLADMRRAQPGQLAVNGAGEHLPFRGDRFDRVFCLDVLEHVADHDQTILEIRRTLKPGGIAVVSVPIEIGPPLLIKQVASYLLKFDRTESYSWKELCRAALVSSVAGLQHDRGHKGFDYRMVLRSLQQNFDLIRMDYSPFRALGSLASTKAIFVVQKES